MGSLHLRQSAVGFVALVVAFGGAGCEEEDPSDPGSSATRSSESAPTSPSEPTTTATVPVEPTLPPEAEAETKAGAEAFVEYYWEVVNYAQKTGDVGLLKELDQPSCEGCAGGIQFIEDVYARGGRVVGGDYRVIRVESARSPSGSWAITTHTVLRTQRVVGAGDINREYPGGRSAWLVAVSRFDEAWNVTTLEGL